MGSKRAKRLIFMHSQQLALCWGCPPRIQRLAAIAFKMACPVGMHKQNHGASKLKGGMLRSFRICIEYLFEARMTGLASELSSLSRPLELTESNMPSFALETSNKLNALSAIPSKSSMPGRETSISITAFERIKLEARSAYGIKWCRCVVRGEDLRGGLSCSQMTRSLRGDQNTVVVRSSRRFHA